ncbi:hypothetical protein ACRAWF_36255 [Streptomyces sp. L7]
MPGATGPAADPTAYDTENTSASSSTKPHNAGGGSLRGVTPTRGKDVGTRPCPAFLIASNRPAKHGS